MKNDRKLVLDLLLENGADVNVGTYERWRIEVPVLVAIQKEDVKLVRKLVGREQNSRINSPIHISAAILKDWGACWSQPLKPATRQ